MNRRKREELILISALKVLARQGYAATCVADIIDEAQVARGTFYLYFKSKQDLFHALLDGFFTQINSEFTKISADVFLNEIDPANNLRQQLTGIISTLTKNRLLAELIFKQVHTLEADCQAKISLFLDQTTQVIESTIQARVRSGEFRFVNAKSAARSIIGSVKEAVFHWLTREPFEFEQNLSGMIDFILAALLPPLSTHAMAGEAQNANARISVGNLH
ncbi:MAG TPA: hypothetical protein DDW49_10405 [Deltaproteobacteria bacterium]|nr:MAG: hypothetical protein A2048_00435 [Deltaproteobacteria bacterium GWA2_45_12]HBF13774.1 hypothetical protein [Deltaproteobacteria bacterium]